MQTTFKAYNFDPAVKAEAEKTAAVLTALTDKTHVVEYRDHYDDTRICGDYIVRPR
jgi:hypothetical protein